MVAAQVVLTTPRSSPCSNRLDSLISPASVSAGPVSRRCSVRFMLRPARLLASLYRSDLTSYTWAAGGFYSRASSPHSHPRGESTMTTQAPLGTSCGGTLTRWTFAVTGCAGTLRGLKCLSPQGAPPTLLKQSTSVGGGTCGYRAFPNEYKRDWVRRYMTPSATAGVANVFSPSSVLANTSNLRPAARTTT